MVYLWTGLGHMPHLLSHRTHSRRFAAFLPRSTLLRYCTSRVSQRRCYICLDNSTLSRDLHMLRTQHRFYWTEGCWPWIMLPRDSHRYRRWLRLTLEDWPLIWCRLHLLLQNAFLSSVSLWRLQLRRACAFDLPSTGSFRFWPFQGRAKLRHYCMTRHCRKIFGKTSGNSFWRHPLCIEITQLRWHPSKFSLKRPSFFINF